MKSLMTLLVLCLSFNTFSADVFRIEIGKDHRKYSDRELRKRIWNLERAVWQLQQKVFQLQDQNHRNAINSKSNHTWVCTLDGMGSNYSASGPTKAVAKSRVIDKCSKKEDSFFCKRPKCEQ